MLGFIGGYFWRTATDRKYKQEKEFGDFSAKASGLSKKLKKRQNFRKKTAILEAKDEWFKAKSEFEKEAAKHVITFVPNSNDLKKWSLILNGVKM